jgi:hypothetical protein
MGLNRNKFKAEPSASTVDQNGAQYTGPIKLSEIIYAAFKVGPRTPEKQIRYRVS